MALLGLIISKEQKVSEFRQQWIDALREDIAASDPDTKALSLATDQLVSAAQVVVEARMAASSLRGDCLPDSTMGSIAHHKRAGSRIAISCFQTVTPLALFATSTHYEGTE